MARGVSIRGKFVSWRNVSVQYEGVAILLTVVLTLGKLTPKSNFTDGN